MNIAKRYGSTVQTEPASTRGASTFTIKPSSFREQISHRPGSRFQAAPGRYHLYVMYGCPWAHRTLIVRALKGLEQVVDVTAVSHRMVEEEGWAFAADRPEPLYGLSHLRQLYEMAHAGYQGRIAVPVLWDKREMTIVNNESSEIMRMFNSAFDAYAARPSLDLYPTRLRGAINAWNEHIYGNVNAGVYAAGFATSQLDYEQAVSRLFATLDELEVYLGVHRYLVGDSPTEADWRLFPTLVRLEWVYHDLFKCNLRRLVDYPNLLAYTRELYQWPHIASTIDVRRTIEGYYGSLLRLNPSGTVPSGPLVDFDAPHGRGAVPYPTAGSSLTA